MLLRRKKIPSFSQLVLKVKTQEYRKTMLTANRIPKKKLSANPLKPVLPLVPEKLDATEEDKTKFITIELKARVGSPAGSATYKKHIRKFDEGTCQQWIDLLKDVKEIWTQNTITGGTDKASTLRALLTGESLTGFETHLEDARRNAEGELQTIEPEMVDTAIENLANTVFPYRALEVQKNWMLRDMKKPYSLTTRKTASAITRINNVLPMFPGGTEESKFSNKEVVGLLEYALPVPWRVKFDLDGYTPTDHDKARLIRECEAIERNQEETANHPEKEKKDKSGSKRKKDKLNSKPFYCTEHGPNNTHASKDCFTLKNREKKGNGKPLKDNGKKPFTPKSFRQELNALARKTSKKEVLDLYASVLAKETAKYNESAKTRKRKQAEPEEDSSDSDESFHVIDVDQDSKKPAAVSFKLTEKTVKKKKKTKKSPSETTEEEREFLKRVNQMEDKESEEESES